MRLSALVSPFCGWGEDEAMVGEKLVVGGIVVGVTQVEQSCRLTQEPTNTQIHQRKVVGGAMLKVSNRHLNVGQLVFSQSETTPSQNKPRLSKLFVKSIFWVQIGP